MQTRCSECKYLKIVDRGPSTGFTVCVKGVSDFKKQVRSAARTCKTWEAKEEPK